MATPTAGTNQRQVGHHGWTLWQAAWALGTEDNFTDEIVVDLSALTTYTSRLRVTWISIVASTGLAIDVAFKNTANQPIVRHPIGASGPIDIDFTPFVDGNMPNTGSGGTGDIVLTTRSAADGDEAYILVEWFVT